MLKAKRENDQLTIYLSGEIDHCGADAMRIEMETMLLDLNIRHLILDFSQVSFMDSSGVGLIIGRYKTMTLRTGSVCACGLNETVNRIFHMAGLHRIIPVINVEMGA